jgi:beta-glucosidase
MIPEGDCTSAAPNDAARARREFHWGVATSGYQTEGGYNGPGEPLNNWAWAERDGDVPVSGRSADFWNQSPHDFSLCQSMGLSAFRFSLEWSRIQPCYELPPKKDGALPPPSFDDEALHHYAALIANCRRAGLEPVVTLHHFTHPAWLGMDAWLEPETVTHFVEFVRHTVSYLLRVLPTEFQCAPPRYFITVNEPNMLAINHYLSRAFPTNRRTSLGLTVQCLGHLLEAHARATLAIRELYAGQTVRPQVTFNNYCSDLYWTDGATIDLFFCRAKGVPRSKIYSYLRKQMHQFNRDFLTSRLLPQSSIRFHIGEWIKRWHAPIGSWALHQPSWRRVIDLIYSSPEPLLDYIAFDYYDPFVAHALRWPHFGDYEPRRRSLRDWLLESLASKWWDWRVLPEGLAFFARQLARRGLPLLIAENGMAQRRRPDNTAFNRPDRVARSSYLREHIRQIKELLTEGCPLIGYLHWSLVDNYEWGSYTPRFGLFHIDYTTPQPGRIAVDYLGDNPSETYAEEVRRFRE